MTPGARVAAAIEVLEAVERQRRPVADALKDWGLSHRFAGSGDRAAIADLAYDALRTRASAAWSVGEGARAAVLAAALPAGAAAAADWAQDRHAPTLTDAEAAALEPAARGARLAEAPPWVRGDYPEWLDGSLTRAFGAARAEEGAALATRPPTDLRVNRLKAEREQVRAALARHPALAGAPDAPALTPWSPDGLRLPASVDVRRMAPTATAEFLAGAFEIQDEGSQLAALLAGAQPGWTVGDLCAGGGGKTLALAAAMGDRGRLVAYDVDARRLAKTDERLRRAGVTCAALRFPGAGVLDDLAGALDLAVVDAPCTGSGTWRRNPDAKWRLRPNALALRQREQAAALALAAPLVKPGGRLAYITCSVLPEENDDQLSAFLTAAPAFRPLPVAEVAQAALGAAAPAFLAEALPTAHGLQLTPRRTGTDGFFFSLLERAG